jgi:hypothetical protein
MGRSIWLDRDRCACWTAGGGLRRSEDFGVEIGAFFGGGVGGAIGTARPTSVCPRAFSTLGRLKRLNRDILEGARSSFGGGVLASGVGALGAGCATC